MIRVVVVDDETLVRDGLCAIAELEDGIEVVGEAGDGQDALRVVEQTHPDVVLMDIQMPVMDGVEATRRLCDRPDAPKVIVLTTFDRNEYVYEALRAGASAFLLKDLHRRQLTSAVRAVVEGETLVAPAITRRLVETYCQGPPQVDGRPAALAVLTEREVEVMALVAAGRSNSEIAAELFLAEATVKTHVARTVAKLHLRDRVQLVVLAYESGLVRARG
ncbi:MAG TPA: response regulator transcription factor [Actinomycetales bacterium]|nr:response regulator transcription factor [Actinomycetales bacterium]